MLALSDGDVRRLVSPDDAIALAETVLALEPGGGSSSWERVEGGTITVAPSVASGGGSAAGELLLNVRGTPVLWTAALVSTERPAVQALVASGWLACLAAGAVCAAAARRLALPEAGSVGLIGCGQLAEAHLACLRAGDARALRAAVYCRTPSRVEAFCRAYAADPAEYGRDAATADVVVTATSSRDPVLRGDWLRPGTLVCAAGATERPSRELDNTVLERAAFVCCDDLAEARRRAGDLIEPVERGVLDWLEVHSLGEVVAGGLPGRQSAEDIVLVKTVGLPLLRLELARLAVARAGA